MHFSDKPDGKSSKFVKIGIVAALHVAVGVALVHNMDSKMFTMPKVVDDIVMLTLDAPKPPPPPPEPPQPKQKPVVQPQVVAPVVEVEVPQQPAEPTIQAAAEPTPAADPGPVTPPAPASTTTGKLFSAALADADSCAKPAYPPKAARDGDTGTVSLALLIGVDGHVSDSKIQKSSGSRELDRAAQSALALCKFKPALANGTPEPAWGKIAYVWTLE
ncbi:MAG: TonB family protein [Pseudomonadota bacterium]